MHVMEVRRAGDGLPKVRSRMRDRLDGPITESYRCRDADDDRAGAEFIVRYLSQHDRRHRTGDALVSVSIEASGLGRSHDVEALVKDDQETARPLCGKALFPVQLFDAVFMRRPTVLPLPGIMHDQA